MLNSSFSFYIALVIAKYTTFIIDESSIIDNYRSSSCLDNDESYLDF